EILVESTATIISATNGMAISRVSMPVSNSRPPTISRYPTKAAVKCGNGIPSLVKRPTPWFAYTNFRRPSHKNTPPAISLKSSMDFGPPVGGFKIHVAIFLILIGCSFSPDITGGTLKYSRQLLTDRGQSPSVFSWPLARLKSCPSRENSSRGGCRDGGTWGPSTTRDGADCPVSLRSG